MSKIHSHEKRHYTFSLTLESGNQAHFQDYDGPSLKTAEAGGSRILTLKNGVAGLDAIKDLAEWFRSMADGKADGKQIVVSDDSTFDKANSSMESAGFSGASIVSLNYAGGTASSKIDKMEVYYSFYRPFR